MTSRLFPSICIDCGDTFAAIGSRSTIQSPLLFAVVDLSCPSKRTVTASPADAVPHTGTIMSRCNTAWSLNIAGTDTSARAGTRKICIREKRTGMANRLFISSSFYRQQRNKGGLFQL
jgi:hypothetical protein